MEVKRNKSVIVVKRRGRSSVLHHLTHTKTQVYIYSSATVRWSYAFAGFARALFIRSALRRRGRVRSGVNDAVAWKDRPSPLIFPGGLHAYMRPVARRRIFPLTNGVKRGKGIKTRWVFFRAALRTEKSPLRRSCQTPCSWVRTTG